jgi:hypothetical protein|tara:strand:+ start:2229 stop:2492 length:264 start_codon:yes stop_codon:yes gene_type:complete
MAITDIFAGDGGTLLKEIKTVDLTAQCDGIVSTFTMPEVYLSGSLWVSWNGLRVRSADITEASPTTFTLSVTPRSTDELIVDYKIGG